MDCGAWTMEQVLQGVRQGLLQGARAPPRSKGSSKEQGKQSASPPPPLTCRSPPSCRSASGRPATASPSPSGARTATPDLQEEKNRKNQRGSHTFPHPLTQTGLLYSGARFMQPVKIRDTCHRHKENCPSPWLKYYQNSIENQGHNESKFGQKRDRTSS